MAKSNSTAELERNTYKPAMRLGKQFARASLTIDADSISGKAMQAIQKLREGWRDCPDLAQMAFCEGVATELRRAGKGVKHV